MADLFKVHINFATSQLIFPTIIACVLAVLGIAIAITHRHRIAGAGAHWRAIAGRMDKMRFFGAIGLTLVYFSTMQPVGNLWPNTGMGFLLTSIPFVFLCGVLFLHDRRPGNMIGLTVAALVAPTLVWWVFADLFFLTLP
ncbi:tripartite tricarboxylate transporter TctB family protein [Acidimangrovimonas sediminis]|uniref:tripartite tricarboxylate transporter TctB family protein n=1 Tax=Acidimangrovimonas sediminis TaxID=2056283 RepID=UPI000C8071A6|nr:tripartite tricarboxylate transporter TctB family protein [Acidimangrovimonas sediminis]